MHVNLPGRDTRTRDPKEEDMNALTLFIFAAAAMAVSLIATIFPARSATRIAPVESLRYE